MKAGRVFIIIGAVVLLGIIASWTMSKPKIIPGNVTSVIDYNTYQLVSVDTTRDSKPELIDVVYNFKFRSIEKLSKGSSVNLAFRKSLFIHDITIY